MARTRFLATRFDLRRPAELFARCLLCNVTLDQLAEAEAVELVPPAARGLPGVVRRCPECGRIYWRGSHARRMEAALQATLGWTTNDLPP